MTGTCDHEHCTTPHCPYCGVRMRRDAIGELRAYMQGKLKASNTWIKKAEQSKVLSEDARSYAINRHRDICGRWQSWLDALDALLQKAK